MNNKQFVLRKDLDLSLQTFEFLIILSKDIPMLKTFLTTFVKKYIQNKYPKDFICPYCKNLMVYDNKEYTCILHTDLHLQSIWDLLDVKNPINYCDLKQLQQEIHLLGFNTVYDYMNSLTNNEHYTTYWKFFTVINDNLYSAYIKYLTLLKAIYDNARINKYQNDAKDYLKARGFNDFIIQQTQPFLVGYSLDEVKAFLDELYVTKLTNIFKDKDEFDNYCNEFEFYALNSKNEYYSVLQNRVGLVVTNQNQDIVNFDLRLIKTTSQFEEARKYVFVTSHPKTSLILATMCNQFVTSALNHLPYFKPKMLKDTIYISEGIYDTLSLKQKNLNAVCGLTKTLSTHQIGYLLHAKNVCLSYDLDNSGITGCLATSSLLINANITPSFIYCPSYSNIKDWNDLLKANLEFFNYDHELNYLWNISDEEINAFFQAVHHYVYYSFSKKHYCDFIFFKTLILILNLIMSKKPLKDECITRWMFYSWMNLLKFKTNDVYTELQNNLYHDYGLLNKNKIFFNELNAFLAPFDELFQTILNTDEYVNFKNIFDYKNYKLYEKKMFNEHLIYTKLALETKAIDLNLRAKMLKANWKKVDTFTNLDLDNKLQAHLKELDV